jgi:F0F1-type ATP synthase assembly protein I
MKLDRNMMLQGSRFLAMGFELAGAIVGGLVLGHYVDQYLGTEGVFTLICTLAGMVGAIRVLLWTHKRTTR